MATAPFYFDGDYTIAAPCGQVRFEQPFAGDKGAYVLMQDLMQFAANFTALALNTPHPLYPTFFLVSESPLQDVGGGVAHWTRKYAQVPNPRNDFSSLAYSFIGYYGKTANIVNVVSFPVLGRGRLTLTVPCRIRNEYFIWVNGNVINDSTGTNVYAGPAGAATPSAIPVILGQRYYIPLGNIAGGVFTPTYPAGSALDIAFGAATDFIWDPAAFSGVVPTIPSRTQYQVLVTNGAEIVTEDSQLARWQGNIYVRTTKYVVAR